MSTVDEENNFKTPIGLKSFFPKRISELSPLESSDEEEVKLLNPESLCDSTVGVKQTGAKNDIVISRYDRKIHRSETSVEQEKKSTESTISRQLNFDVPSEITKERPVISLFSKIQSVNSSQTQKQNHCDVSPMHIARSPVLAVDKMTFRSSPTSTDFVSFGDKSGSAAGKPNTTKCVDNLNIESIATVNHMHNSRTQNTEDAVNSNNINNTMKPVSELAEEETPCKIFQMPSARRLPPSNRRLVTNDLKNSRTAMENEFRSQKVLFTTPSAVSRPIINLLSNVGLDDSLNCYKSSPVVINTSPQKVQQRSMSSRTLTANSNASEVISIKKMPKERNDSAQSNDKTKIIQINGKEFVMHKKIGQGGSSSVFLAEHKEKKLECAVKVVDLRGDPALIDGYVKEVKILANLQGNENVIRLYEYALLSSENLMYMVMEKGDSDLRNLLHTHKTTMPLYTLMNLWYQMLQSVNYIHSKDVIHSDLKPENFLLVNGRLKLIDFGISSKIAVDATSIIKYSQVGTFNYISPEALMDTSSGNSPFSKKNQPKIKISTKSDVWSLGCILYLLLYKKTPFAHIINVYAKMQAIIDPNKQIEYAELPNFYPPMLVEMVQKCLKHNPKERSTVAELLNYPFNMIIPL